jgi:hypothetical protein
MREDIRWYVYQYKNFFAQDDTNNGHDHEAKNRKIIILSIVRFTF